MRSRVQLPQPMQETGLLKEDRRKFNQLLRAVERLIPVADSNEIVDVTSSGTYRRRAGGTGTTTTDTGLGRWE